MTDKAYHYNPDDVELRKSSPRKGGHKVHICPANPFFTGKTLCGRDARRWERVSDLSAGPCEYCARNITKYGMRVEDNHLVVDRDCTIKLVQNSAMEQRHYHWACYEN